MKKKVLIPLLIIIVILPFLIVIYPVIKNNNYKEELLNNIYQNTDLKEITYLNKNNNYYIVKTKKKVIVLDLNYEQKFSLDLNELNKSTLEIVYRRGNLYYEEKIKEDEKLIYTFYNIETGKREYQTSLGGA